MTSGNGRLFCSCSYHSSGQDNTGPEISARPGPWLAFYPDKVTVGTNFIPQYGAGRQDGLWPTLFSVKVHFKSIVDVAIPTCKLSDSL